MRGLRGVRVIVMRRGVLGGSAANDVWTGEWIVGVVERILLSRSGLGRRSGLSGDDYE